MKESDYHSKLAGMMVRQAEDGSNQDSRNQAVSYTERSGEDRGVAN